MPQLSIHQAEEELPAEAKLASRLDMITLPPHQAPHLARSNGNKINGTNHWISQDIRTNSKIELYDQFEFAWQVERKFQGK